MSETVAVLEEFFAPAEVAQLWVFALSHAAGFVPSEVIGDDEEGRQDDDFRRSLVLFDVDGVLPMVSERVMAHLPFVLERLDMAPFSVSEIELQATLSNDGEWFRPHRDSGAGNVRSRELTFVYYCHREPRAFTGGELRLFEPFSDGLESDATTVTINPLQNAMTFFPSHYLHEVCPVRCPSGDFIDARLTFNGWLHR